MSGLLISIVPLLSVSVLSVMICLRLARVRQTGFVDILVWFFLLEAVVYFVTCIFILIKGVFLPSLSLDYFRLTVIIPKVFLMIKIFNYLKDK
jgi:hypothetical protein